MNKENKATPKISAASDPAFVKRALEQASINVLRIALFHQTHDSFLSDMPVTEHELRGGALSTYVVPKNLHADIRARAFDFLVDNKAHKPDPTKQEVKHLMTLFSGQQPNSVELDYGYEELGFEAFPRDAHWSTATTQKPNHLPKDFRVAIIGSGFSGLAMAAQLGRLGFDYDIIERHSKLGGTWQVNDYPEARVDVPSFSYQYSFEKNYPWTHFFAPRDALREYAEHIAEKYQIKPNIRFDTKLIDAAWNEDTSAWSLELETDNGERSTRHYNAVVSACGLFGTALLPDINGIERFEGEMFHTTQWNHDFDYSGKRVAVIGTGSTGTQLARALAKTTSKLTIFQRTANWVTPIEGYHAEVSNELRWLFDNMPGYQNWFNYANSVSEFRMQDMHELDPQWIAKGGKVNEKNQQLRESLTQFIRHKVGGDEAMIDKLVPTHSPMSRRLVIDNQWYDTLMRDNVELVADGIQEITDTGIVDANGVTHEVDLIVLGAGFKVSQYLWPVEYKGRDGLSIEQLWNKDGARAFKGMTMPGFPNFFMIYGPNAQARAGSFHSVVESLSRYIGNLLVATLEQGKQTIEVKGEAYENYNQRLDKAMQTLLWEDEQGGGGYYVNEHGRAGVIMPWRIHEFFEMIQTPDLENYTID